ncbi:MAG: DUF4062 domain-containing protein [Pyrinomonadaceae bacterium]
MSTSKPRIYISSTIYDFRDLRSALKYWLEELGYEVMLSEFNDFTKPLDENSYTACLRAVERADYFILLVGMRVGGFYDYNQKLSITRIEYRTAYELVRSGKLKLVTLVREDLWNVREDRKALKDFLLNDYRQRKEIDNADAEAIISHPSTIVNDVDATFDFLNEIGRVAEMKQAMTGEGRFPVGNWIHQFATFQDIVETLRTEFSISHSLSRLALTFNLKREILSNLTLLTWKHNGKIYLSADLNLGKARTFLSGELDSSSLVPGKYLGDIARFMLVGTGKQKLSTQFIDQALTSGEYLEYDSDTNTYKGGVLTDALFQLKNTIHYLSGYWEYWTPEKIAALIENFKPYWVSKRDATVRNIELLPVFAIDNCERNVMLISSALLNALDGERSGLSNLNLHPLNPLVSEDEKIRSETITIKDIEDFLSQ